MSLLLLPRTGERGGKHFKSARETHSSRVSYRRLSSSVRSIRRSFDPNTDTVRAERKIHQAAADGRTKTTCPPRSRTRAYLFTSTGADVWPWPRYRWTTSFAYPSTSMPTDSSTLCNTNMTPVEIDDNNAATTSGRCRRDVSGEIIREKKKKNKTQKTNLTNDEPRERSKRRSDGERTGHRKLWPAGVITVVSRV